ncbi:hypothetical protein TrCOL_g13728 [Triparma columacea]|uniref:RRM domain-containing protein n=1 Tax=Triparma columacea TaxID=722753 RepID=A0A9W7FXG0_9STRA|nr:hypothetical protein TrCOL_g13728 [Triparma columacea]
MEKASNESNNDVTLASPSFKAKLRLSTINSWSYLASKDRGSIPSKPPPPSNRKTSSIRSVNNIYSTCGVGYTRADEVSHKGKPSSSHPQNSKKRRRKSSSTGSKKTSTSGRGGDAGVTLYVSNLPTGVRDGPGGKGVRVLTVKDVTSWFGGGGVQQPEVEEPGVTTATTTTKACRCSWVKLYRDHGRGGVLKGDALCGFVDSDGARLGLKMDGVIWEGKKVKVEFATESWEGGEEEGRGGDGRTVKVWGIYTEGEVPEDREGKGKFFEDLREEIMGEVSKFGDVVNLTFGGGVVGLGTAEGLTTVEYGDEEGARRCQESLRGRAFGGRVLQVEWEGTGGEGKEGEGDRDKGEVIEEEEGEGEKPLDEGLDSFFNSLL